MSVCVDLIPFNTTTPCTILYIGLGQYCLCNRCSYCLFVGDHIDTSLARLKTCRILTQTCTI
jgi:hypothetical protein